MTKVRTVIPANAKPGKSVIQVMHPKTGKPTRVRVPKAAIPGQMVELELPDETLTPSGAMRVSNEKAADQPQSGEVTSIASTRSSGNTAPLPLESKPSQLPTPPISKDKGVAILHEEQPLLEKSRPKVSKSTGCCTSCLTNPLAFTASLFS